MLIFPLLQKNHNHINDSVQRNQGLLLRMVLTTMALGLLVHGFCYANAFFSHDSLLSVTQTEDIFYKISLGRYIQALTIKLRGTVAAPWLLGVLSLFWLSLSNFFMVKTLDIQRHSLQYLLCGLMTTHSALSLTNATYIHESDAFMLALLCATVAIYLLHRFRFGWIVAPVCIGVGCGLYQSYFAVAVALAMVVLFKALLDGQPWKTVIFKGIQSVLVLIAGLVLYVMGCNYTLQVTGIAPFEGYNGISSMLDFSASSLVELVVGTYSYFFKTLLSSPTHFIGLLPYLVVAIALLCAILLAHQLLKNPCTKPALALLAVLLVLMPFGMGVIYFASKGVVHSLMSYGVCCVYLLPLVLMDRVPPEVDTPVTLALHWGRTLLAGLLCVLFFSNSIYANQVYLEKELMAQSTLSVMTRVVYEMEQTPGYAIGQTPVVIVGTLGATPLNLTRTGFEHLSGTGQYSNLSITYSFASYFNYVLSYPITLANDQIATFTTDAQVMDMPCYPTPGYCQMVNDHLVVKFS